MRLLMACGLCALSVVGFAEDVGQEYLADKGIFQPQQEASMPEENKDFFPQSEGNQNYTPKSEEHGHTEKPANRPQKPAPKKAS